MTEEIVDLMKEIRQQKNKIESKQLENYKIIEKKIKGTKTLWVLSGCQDKKMRRI